MSVNPDLKDQIRNLIATMLRTSSAEVVDTTSLAPLLTSLGSAKIRLGLKRLGFALTGGVTPSTFGALWSALSGEATPVATPALSANPEPSVSTFASNGAAPKLHGSRGFQGLQVGLDVEEISSLPVASDYWEHEFYRGTFARSEIAYAVLHAEPRAHFAGFWCVKEALRKCDPSFAGISMERTAVAHDPDGRPYITLETEAGLERLSHAVSISHTTAVATAVVVASPVFSEIAPVAPPVAQQPPAPSPEAKKSRGLAKLFGI